jgi:hypothetical protein
MRIRATCNECGRDFLFLELYDAELSQADRCPQCGVHLGVVNLRHLARAADRNLAALVRVLDQIADRSPGFTVESGSLLRRLENAVDALTQPANQREAA